MRTRSHQEPSRGGATEAKAPELPRSSKKRKAHTAEGGAKKPKDEAASLEPHDDVTSPAAVTPTKAGKRKGSSLAEANASARAIEEVAEATWGKEDQSLGKSKDLEGGADGIKRAGVAPKGRCVSGRDWKVRHQSQRASMQRTTATATLSTTWAKKLEIKAKRQAIMAMEKEMRDAKRQEIEDKKKEKLEREKRRQQNEMKNTTYQTISKTHKMKTMSKKQLRQIKKRQVNSRTGEVEFVSPWGGGKKK